MHCDISENDARSLCRAIKLRAGELRKESKKLREMERPSEAQNLEAEVQDLAGRLGPMFDEQGTFNFGPAGKKAKGAPKDEAQVALELERKRSRHRGRKPREDA